MKSYIGLNIEKRKEAVRKGDKVDLFKLFNNAVFGKTMENRHKKLVLKSLRQGRLC